MDVYQLVYVSHATTLLTTEQLVKILDVAQIRNREEGLTGLLLYKDKLFIQLLEGSKASIEKVFTSIQKDDRHYRINTLVDCNLTDTRLFPNWSMGFINLNNPNVGMIEGYEDVFSGNFDFPTSTSTTPTVVKLLMHFRDNS